MSFHVKFVANSFLYYEFQKRASTITPMKLQKIVYCLHGIFLANTNQPAIDGKFEAWPHGPVNEELYHMVKEFGHNPVTKYIKSWEGNEEKAFMVPIAPGSDFSDNFEIVVEKYIDLTAYQLRALTHAKGTPWYITRENNEQVIEDDLIRDHFLKLI